MAAMFTLAVDTTSVVFRRNAIMEMTGEYLSDIAQNSYNHVMAIGPEAVNPNESRFFNTLDVYITDDDQNAVTKPRFSEVGRTVMNKSIARALELEPGVIESWMSPSDYRGQQVVSAYTSIMIDGKKHALLAEIDQQEIAERIEPWWVFSDVAWQLMFGLVGAMCLVFLRRDITRVVSPEAERRTEEKESAYAMLVKSIVEFPIASIGRALVDGAGVISHCSVGFAKILGADFTRELVGTSVHNRHKDPERHRKYFESFSTDLVERPVTCVGVNGQDVDILLTVKKLNGMFEVVIRRNSHCG
jgi:PAS domain-containing protein